MHQRYSSSVSPFHANTGTPVAAILHTGTLEQDDPQKIDYYSRGGGVILGGEDVLCDRDAYQIMLDREGE